MSGLAHTLIAVAGVVAAVAGAGSLLAALGLGELGREELAEPAAHLAAYCFVVSAATLPGFHRTDLPGVLGGRVDRVAPERVRHPLGRPPAPPTHLRIVHVVGRVDGWVGRFAHRLTLPATRRLHRLAGPTRGWWPCVVVAISVALLVLARVRSGATTVAILGALGCSVAILAHAHRRGRPWVFVAVSATCVAGALGDGAAAKPLVAGLGAGSLLVALMLSLLHLVELCAEGQPRRAKAVVVGLTVGLLVALTGPLLFDFVGFGQAREAREGALTLALGVLASVLASVLVAYFPDREADLRAERSRAEDAEAALAEMRRRYDELRGRYDELARGSAGPPAFAAGDSLLRRLGAWCGVAQSNRRT